MDFQAKCFYQLDNLPKIPEIFFEYASGKTRYNTVDKQDWPKITTAKSNEFSETSFFKRLQKKFVVVADYFKNDPCSYYKFHTDVRGRLGVRTASINVLLSDHHDAVTMFKSSDINSLTYGVLPCKYQRFVPMLFNPQILHAVLNHTDTPRYILSIGFYNTPYEEVKRYLTETDFSDVSYA